MRAIIFDFDGVLVDSERLWAKKEKAMFRKIIEGWSDADQGKLMGLSMDGAFRLLRAEYQFPLSEKEFRAAHERIAGEIYGEHAKLFPGVARLLGEIDAAGIPLGVASSSRLSWIMAALERFELDLLFTTVVSGEEFPNDGKPSPTIYRVTAEQLGVQPEDCLAIEDSTNGIRAAKDAGMACIAFRSQSNAAQDLSAADAVTDTLQLHLDGLLKLVAR